MQFLLARMVITDVVRRVVGGSEPDGLWMMGIVGLALVANVAAPLLLAAERRARTNRVALTVG